ncbi:hypothetical protein [Streptomyces sp. HUAS ZL42]|uniref:hypothetical protein n=1 Tax=Streptomyces sp. HUAS ZL42 TaxID=3231715 RepID=UPI00345E6A8F
MSETNAGGARQRSVETVAPVHNAAHGFLPLKFGLAACFSDAQRGFEAVRADVFRSLAVHRGHRPAGALRP